MAVTSGLCSVGIRSARVTGLSAKSPDQQHLRDPDPALVEALLGFRPYRVASHAPAAPLVSSGVAAHRAQASPAPASCRST